MFTFPKFLLLFSCGGYLAILTQAFEPWINEFEQLPATEIDTLIDWYNEFENPLVETIGVVTPLSGPSPDILISDFGRRSKRAIEGLDYEIPLDCQRIKSNNDKRVTKG